LNEVCETLQLDDLQREIVLNKYLKKNLELVSDFFLQEDILLTNNINSPEVYENICNFKPDLIIVRGTSIIKKPLINYDIKHFLNIHGGIVPNYRNVHGLFWSYYFKDFSNMCPRLRCMPRWRRGRPRAPAVATISGRKSATRAGSAKRLLIRIPRRPLPSNLGCREGSSGSLTP